MKHIVIALLATCAAVAPASAEPLRLAQAGPMGVLPPHEILTLVRSAGLDPIGRPMLRGPHYVLTAIGGDDRELRVLVDARSGGILSITPLTAGARVPPPGVAIGAYEPRPVPPRGVPMIDDDQPPPPGMRLGPYERIPGPGYGPPPSVVYRGPAPIMTEEPAAPPIRPPTVGALPPREGALPPSREAAPLPPGAVPPRVNTATPNPDEVASVPEQDEATPSTSLGPSLGPSPGQSGPLPPPPDRFQQRVAPPSADAAKPKPVKRAAAAMMPKQAPLPRPRPVATPASAQPTPPAPPAPAESAPGVPTAPAVAAHSAPEPVTGDSAPPLDPSPKPDGSLPN